MFWSNLCPRGTNFGGGSDRTGSRAVRKVEQGGGLLQKGEKELTRRSCEGIVPPTSSYSTPKFQNHKGWKTTNQKKNSAPSIHRSLRNDMASSYDKIYARRVMLRLLLMWPEILGGAS